MSGTLSRLSLETAAELLDFRGNGMSAVSEHAAREQLEGAVALHNTLIEHNVAYLADEVGMGKTYVALGTLALFRHFDPSFRVLVLAPRENIQRKWVKELKNFVTRVLRFPDLRVKAVHGVPARAAVVCESLVELVRETAIDADRDFFTRLTSFSLPLGTDAELWKAKRNQLQHHLPWLDSELFDLRRKEAFKDNFAKAVNCGLPEFDLIIVDEGHNLKGGLRGNSSRNRVVALAFGHPSLSEAVQEGFRGYGRRARRVLFLSATPLEHDYAQLWNQLDVFGFGRFAHILKHPDSTDEQKREFAREFLIRRVTSLPVAGQRLTKNLYRREWPRGGVASHDEPLEIPDERQRLTVALVQKKVSEVLGSTKFNNRFQIGMLASFESFLETARVRPRDANPDDESNFDQTEQTEDEAERRGVDVGSVNNLARSYRRWFNAELPHPKMDALVNQLASAFTTGQKALVFVRRIASVKELQRKLEERYDSYLFSRLRNELPREVRQDLERVIRQYLDERARERQTLTPVSGSVAELDEEEDPEPINLEDTGGLESFFGWFFRGEGPGGRVLSGATLQKRFTQAGSAYSTLFEDNHVAWLLDAKPGDVTRALVDYLRLPKDVLVSDLARRATGLLPREKKQRRRNVFLAFQQAAIELLSEHAGDLQARAKVVREERHTEGKLISRGAPEPPELDDWLEVATFWTDLRQRRQLRDALWPKPVRGDFREQFRESELRRELFFAMVRLGHPFIDLYVLIINRIGSMQLRAREQSLEAETDLLAAYLDLLARQREQPTGVHTGYTELLEAASNFDLIISVNDPELRAKPLTVAATEFARFLRAQQPIGGMSGTVNATLVKQFRMPGYPFVLITTDLLQEGEDLHTFCSSVYHYGISWMPSSTEQRVGRVDRVGSQTDRRLTALRSAPDGSALLQVYYPHLRDTVEVLQVNRVLDRLNRFLRLMHEDLGGQEENERTIDIGTEIVRHSSDPKERREPLKTGFPVRRELLSGPRRAVVIRGVDSAGLLRRFWELPSVILPEMTVHWEERDSDSSLLGTLQLKTRRQPFTLLLRSFEGYPVIRCVSPVGRLQLNESGEEISEVIRGARVRVCAVFDPRFESYNLTIEGDVVLADQAFDGQRVSLLLQHVNDAADRLEEHFLERDEPLSTFRRALGEEAGYER